MLKRYPFIEQLDITDCGACSLGMIIKYHKGNIPIHIIREELKTNKDGTTAYNIVKYATELGFKSYGLKVKEESLKDIKTPFIAHVTVNNNLKHFIVVYKVLKDGWIIGDPATCIKKISNKEIENIWNNIIITFLPEKKIPYRKDINLKSFVIELFKLNKKDFIPLINLSILVTIFGIISSFMFKEVVDYLSINNNIDTLKLIILFFLIINLFKVITDYFKNEILIIANQKMDILLTMESFKNIILLPYSYYRNRTTGEVVSRINDIESLRLVIATLFSNILVDILLSSSSFLMLLLINKNLTLIALIMFLSYLLIIILFQEVFLKLIEKLKTKKEIINNFMIESINGFETIKGNNIERKIINNFNKLYYKYLKNVFNYERLNNLIMLLKNIIYEVCFLFIVLIGSEMIINKQFTLAMFLTYNTLLSYFLSPIGNIIEYNGLIKKGKVALVRIIDIFSLEPAIKKNKASGFIKVKKLKFGYNNKIILNGINIVFDNTKTMIIGESGSGKSTLFKIINGYYKIDRGIIKIGDSDINDINNIRSYITYVSQNEIMFADTLYNNLTLKDDFEEEEIKKVIKVCELEEIIDKREFGLSSLVEEGGFDLSGGEKQRIYLARALLNKGEFLVIDEGMSEINSNQERRILKNIFKNYSKKIIMISHRIDNMDLFDRIVEMKKGKIEKCLIR